jgi:hypothetical protein
VPYHDTPEYVGSSHGVSRRGGRERRQSERKKGRKIEGWPMEMRDRIDNTGTQIEVREIKRKESTENEAEYEC